MDRRSPQQAAEGGWLGGGYTAFMVNVITNSLAVYVFGWLPVCAKTLSQHYTQAQLHMQYTPATATHVAVMRHHPALFFPAPCCMVLLSA